jgi:phenylalanine-4-hydroxylase
MAQNLPQHLQKYIVEQNYAKYTPLDHAVWRYILRQLRAFLSTHAHPSYLEGLEKTGIEIDRIPKISDISAKLEKFGWRALPVSGFIPPAAFMELQALGVLPIASDMRSLEHLEYTPAPDIVHEAAGHAPILANPEFAAYLREYAQIARKAIISSEDLALYEAIRELSDLKENPESKPAQITAAQDKLNHISKNISHISEAAQLSRMNWWTAEYGLIGSLAQPRIFGAGLLSSVGESRWCLSDKVKKRPLTLDCIETSYDITEPQPQLFVTPDFKTLSKVLEQFAATMAYQKGGLEGLAKAIQAQSLTTTELNSGIQISGLCAEALTEHEKLVYLKFRGPTQLCAGDKELSSHDKKYHKDGFGTPVGFFKQRPSQCPSTFSDADLSALGFEADALVQFQFSSGVEVKGIYKSCRRHGGKLILMTFQDCLVTWKGQTLFDPSWGIYDMAIGSQIVSVFGGPADRVAYGETEDFVAARVPQPIYSDKQKTLFGLYQKVRDLREQKKSGVDLESALQSVLQVQAAQFPQEWLLRLEAYELLLGRAPTSSLKNKVETELKDFSSSSPGRKTVIEDGLNLASQL